MPPAAAKNPQVMESPRRSSDSKPIVNSPGRSLFRKRAMLESEKPAPFDALLRITAPHEWVLVTALLLAVAAAASWALLGRIEVRTTVDGVLALPGSRTTLVAGMASAVREVALNPGDSVDEGAPIVVLAPVGAESLAQMAGAKVGMLAKLIAEQGEGFSAAADAARQVALAEAQAEHLELLALEATGSVVASPGSAAVTAVHVVAGDVVAAGEALADLRIDAVGPVAAVALLTEEEAAKVQPGMAVRIHVQGTSSAAVQTLQGEFVSLADSSRVPPWLNATPLRAAEGRSRLATFSLALPTQQPAWDDLWPCRVEIIRERISPLALLTSAASR